MINKIYGTTISFTGSIQDSMASVPELDEKYTTTENKAKTVTILGSSKSVNSILDSMDLCSKLTADLVRSGYNIQTGCGAYGIMGTAYNSAKENSIRDIETRKPAQNIAIIMQPAWGDEDLDNCVPIGKATSENERLTKFRKTSDTFVVFPGSATTIEETALLIQQNEYSPKDTPLKKIILVGNEFFSGLKQQYQKLFDSKLLKHNPDELFTVLDSEEEILNEIGK